MSQLFQADAGLMRVALFLPSVPKDQPTHSQVAWKRNHSLSKAEFGNCETSCYQNKMNYQELECLFFPESVFIPSILDMLSIAPITQNFNSLYLQFFIMDSQERENLEITTPHHKSSARPEPGSLRQILGRTSYFWISIQLLWTVFRPSLFS